MAKKNDARLAMRDLIEKTGFPRSTIHYYIREGLLPAPSKSTRNMAYYNDDFVRRLKFIKRMKRYNFSLKEIKQYLTVSLSSRDVFYDILLRNFDSQPISLEILQTATGLDKNMLRKLIDLNIFCPIDTAGQYYHNSAIQVGQMIREQLDMGISFDTVLLLVKKILEISSIEIQSFSYQVQTPLMEQHASVERIATAQKMYIATISILFYKLHKLFLHAVLKKQISSAN